MAIQNSARNKRRTRPRWRPGPKHRSLSRGRRRHETELGHLVELVEVDAGLRNLSVLDPEELDAVADDLLVRRRDCASRALKRGGVRAFHQDLLDDPGAAGDLAADLHLAVRERLQPGFGVGSCILCVECVLIFRGSSAHACYPLPRLPPSSTRRRPTYAGCCCGSDCTESKSESCGPFSRTTWKPSGARVALLAGRASYR